MSYTHKEKKKSSTVSLMSVFVFFVASTALRWLFLLPLWLLQGTYQGRAHKADQRGRRSASESAAQARQRCDSNPERCSLPCHARHWPGPLHAVYHLWFPGRLQACSGKTWKGVVSSLHVAHWLHCSLQPPSCAGPLNVSLNIFLLRLNTTHHLHTHNVSTGS